MSHSAVVTDAAHLMQLLIVKNPRFQFRYLLRKRQMSEFTGAGITVTVVTSVHCAVPRCFMLIIA